MTRLLSALNSYEDLYHINESINDIGIFKAIFLAGTPGSGKSYTVRKIRSGRIEPRIVNLDKFIEYYGKNYESYFFDKSILLSTKQLLLYVNSLLPLIIDCTSKRHETAFKRAGILESIGYDTGMIYVNTPIETCLSRAKQRKRVVPEHEIIRAYNLLEKSKPFLRSKFSFFIEVKNDEGELTDEVLQKLFNKVSYFYESTVKNPIGQEVIKQMKSNNWKYLIPNIYSEAELKSLIGDRF